MLIFDTSILTFVSLSARRYRALDPRVLAQVRHLEVGLCPHSPIGGGSEAEAEGAGHLAGRVAGNAPGKNRNVKDA